MPRIRTLRRLPADFGLEAAAGVAGTYRRRAFDLAQLHLHLCMQGAGEVVMLVTEPDLYG